MLTPGLCLRPFRALHSPVFLHHSCCSARPELRSPPAFSLPFRASSRLPRRSRCHAGTSRGFFPPFGASVPRESTYPVRPTAPVKVPRPGFLALFAGCSSLGLAGLFHPADAHRLHPSGTSPLPEPPQLFAAALPPCRWSRGCAPAPSKQVLRRTRPHS